MSSANSIIIATLCSNAAGLKPLSAFDVLNNNSSLIGMAASAFLSALSASAACALVGGLKDESRIYNLRTASGCRCAIIAPSNPVCEAGQEVWELTECNRMKRALDAMNVCTIHFRLGTNDVRFETRAFMFSTAASGALSSASGVIRYDTDLDTTAD